MNDEIKRCPVCAESIKAAAVKCRFCGADLRGTEEETVIFEGHPAAVYTLGQVLATLLTLGVAYVGYYKQSLSMKYYITTQRIKSEQGIFSKTRQSVELFRIDDYNLTLPFGMRFLGYGLLSLKSTDRETPDIVIYGVKNIEVITEQLRGCILRERERRKINVWANA